MKIAVVAPVMQSGERGGAENLYDGLVEALRKEGHDATLVKVPADESSFEKILETYCRCYYLDLDEYDLVISTKAPTYMVRHRNHVSYLLHTIRVFYDMFEKEMNARDPDVQKKRRMILEMDKYGLSPTRIKKHYVNGTPVYRRMIDADEYWKEIPFSALHHPPKLDRFKEPQAGEIVFFPGRLHRWKRPELVIQAMQYVKHDIQLIISGRGEDEQKYREMAKGDDRIKFIGWADDGTMADLYSRSIVVPFVPVGEDYGLITVEAFNANKPVITCTDSGEPANIVKDGESGFVVDPDPARIAEKINYLVEHPEETKRMGEAGYASIKDVTWKHVVSELLDGVSISPAGDSPPEVSVLITDMQPIEPALGGGRLRLKGLYFNMPPEIRASYVGTYDWKGEKYRKISISGGLTETTIPLSDEHFAMNEHIGKLLPGKNIIDLIFPLLVESSPDYLREVYDRALRSDVIVFSHPWLYPAIDSRMDLKKKVVIYDSHNVEYLLRDKILGEQPFARCVSQQIKFVEGALCRAADLVLACSEEDRQSFTSVYGVDPEKILVVPNGVDVNSVRPATAEQKKEYKKKLSISGPAAIFVASLYQPNVQAARYIVDVLADKCPGVTFLIVGGVGEALGDCAKPNVKVCGVVPYDRKNMLLAAADLGINPMFFGSGTNIKMFDFMAAGLPVISTPVGARGIESRDTLVVADPESFPGEIARLLSDRALYDRLSRNGLDLVTQQYDWNKISYRLGRKILETYAKRSPYFSVVIPTIRGPEYVGRIFDRLNRQTFEDFEVVLVDTSGGDNEAEYRRMARFSMKYLSRDHYGPGKARNEGIRFARGKVVAFTDDDCLPDDKWLANARRYFDSEQNIGLEGLVSTDVQKLADKGYRTITNRNYEGIGFMTANLFVRRDVLRRIGGFDNRFERAFREDTDMAWRALEYGKIPYGRDAEVYHPPHKRDIAGESSDERDKMFMYDALLFAKHPEQFVRMLKLEGHYMNNKNYWKYFMEGYRVTPEKGPVDLLLNDPDISRYVPAELKRIAQANSTGRLPV